MRVFSTRNKHHKVDMLTALNTGLAEDGGLFIPDAFPTLNLDALIEGDYGRIQKRIMHLFFDHTNLDHIIDEASSSFTHPLICPLTQAGQAFLLELYHGPSFAFKDVALQILPKLINPQEKTTILTATSGDTGSAALEGFKNNQDFDIFVFYPSMGISEIQRKQMTCIQADNVFVYGIQGNFDDAQKAVKDIFQSDLRDNLKLSSANSINLGRLIPQMAYYVDAYRQLISNKTIKLNDEIVVSVPTGNFGNILAAYYAKKLGLPIKHFICASNSNDVLTEFIQTGKYSLDRDFKITSSPSMDILLSSNLERLLFELVDEDSEKVVLYMNELKTQGFYQLDGVELQKLQSLFSAHSSSEEDVLACILKTYQASRQLMDPHTAIGMDAANAYLHNHPNDVVIVTATASPFKFPKTVLKGLNHTVPTSDFEALSALETYTHMQAPKKLKQLEKQAEVSTRIISVDEVRNVIERRIK